jgi:hypothetical protein
MLVVIGRSSHADIEAAARTDQAAVIASSLDGGYVIDRHDHL